MKKRISYVALVIWLVTACVAGIEPYALANGPTALISEMAGTWDVQQRMWPGPDTQPVVLAGAVARRQLIGDTFLREDMEAAFPSASDAFTRVAYLNYNDVSHRYEYVSIDTRAPQMMTYRSPVVMDQDKVRATGLRVDGGRFFVPQWGSLRNVTFNYRLTIGAVEQGRQVVNLYLTPQLSKTASKEFLAFEYVYTRRSSQ